MPPEHAFAACNDLFGGEFASEEGRGKHPRKRGIWHSVRRQNAPTSLTLREQVCAIAQGSSRDEIPLIHVPLG